jgi:import inner membrane translocase subunit TIM17
MDHTRDPCPWVALNDFGGAFCMGVCCSSFAMALKLACLTDPTSIEEPRQCSSANRFTQAIGGAVWHGVKGFRNSPYGERRIGAITAIKARAPVLGGNFGVWGGMFSTFDCAVKGIRKKEDPYNASQLHLEESKALLAG